MVGGKEKRVVGREREMMQKEGGENLGKEKDYLSNNLI